MKRVCFIFNVIIALFYFFESDAQTLSFSHDNSETSLVNPAGFGQVNGIELAIINRNRLIGNRANARTTAFVFNAAYKQSTNTSGDPLHNKMGLGVMFVNATSSVHHTNEVKLFYAYRIPFLLKKPIEYLEYNKESGLLKLNVAFGIVASLRSTVSQYVDLYYDTRINGLDPLVDKNGNFALLPNVGLGIKVDNPKFAFSFTMPRMLDENYNLSFDNINMSGRVKIGIRHDIKAYPMLGLTSIDGSGNLFDFGAQVFLLNEFGVGFTSTYGSRTEISTHYISRSQRVKVNYYFSIISNFSILGNYALPSHEISIFYTLKRKL